MSGHGAPDIDLSAADTSGLRVAVIASSWHTVIMDGLLDGARRAAAEAGAEVTEIRVPGSFELPVAAARLAPGFDAVAALGEQHGVLATLRVGQGHPLPGSQRSGSDPGVRTRVELVLGLVRHGRSPTVPAATRARRSSPGPPPSVR